MFELTKLNRCSSFRDSLTLTLYSLKYSSISLSVSLSQETQVLRDHESQLVSHLFLLKRVSRIREMVYEKSIIACILICEEEQLVS